MAQIISMPKLSPTMTEGVIARWHKKVGDRVEPGDLLFEVSTDKATIEYNALDGGFLRVIQVDENGKADVGQPLAVLTDKLADALPDTLPNLQAPILQPTPPPTPQKTPINLTSTPPTITSREQKAFPAPLQATAGIIKASPYAKKLAKLKGISLEGVAGSGPNGMVMSRDLEMIAQTHAQETAKPVRRSVVEEIPLIGMRKVIAERLSYSKSTIPHFYCKQEINVGLLLALREQLKQAGVAVTVNDLIVRATALAMKEHPVLRSTYDDKRKVVLRHPHADISIAVTIPGGLITPIVFGAELLSLQEISKTIKVLADKARNNKLQPSEYQGGCLTISNLGMFGVPEFAAIVNPPQAAILAIGAAQAKPVVENEQVVAGHILSITFSCDHRVIDGADAAQFLKTLKDIIELPLKLIL